MSTDVFGTGHFSLAYLKQLPVNNLKIDQIFIKNILSDMNDRKIVQAAISLSKNLGIKVIAEGVEYSGSLDLLEKGGCDISQDYYISRPLPKTEIARWLQESNWR